MKRTRRNRTMYLALAAAAMLGGPGKAAGEELPDDARPMSAVELHGIYHDRSWKWSEGAAYLRDEGRSFIAWAGTGESTSWAEGRWILTDEGQLCLKGEWHSRTGVYPDKTCFVHQVHEGTVYQRREPSGDWYTFLTEDDEESGTLVKEDLVSAKLESIRQALQTGVESEETSSLAQAGDEQDGEGQ